MNLLIFLQNPKQEIGYLSCYNYNKIDGYIYMDVFLYEEQKRRCTNRVMYIAS